MAKELNTLKWCGKEEDYNIGDPRATLGLGQDGVLCFTGSNLAWKVGMPAPVGYPPGKIPVSGFGTYYLRPFMLYSIKATSNISSFLTSTTFFSFYAMFDVDTLSEVEIAQGLGWRSSNSDQQVYAPASGWANYGTINGPVIGIKVAGEASPAFHLVCVKEGAIQETPRISLAIRSLTKQPLYIEQV